MPTRNLVSGWFRSEGIDGGSVLASTAAGEFGLTSTTAMMIQPAPTASEYDALWKMPRLPSERQGDQFPLPRISCALTHLTPIVAMTRATARNTDSCRVRSA